MHLFSVDAFAKACTFVHVERQTREVCGSMAMLCGVCVWYRDKCTKRKQKAMGVRDKGTEPEMDEPKEHEERMKTYIQARAAAYWMFMMVVHAYIALYKHIYSMLHAGLNE